MSIQIMGQKKTSAYSAWQDSSGFNGSSFKTKVLRFEC